MKSFLGASQRDLSRSNDSAEPIARERQKSARRIPGEECAASFFIDKARQPSAGLRTCPRSFCY
jgi:hypothetical protein